MYVMPSSVAWRAAVILMAAALAAVSLPLSALATDHEPDLDREVTHSRGGWALAEWTLEDERNTEVTVGAYESESYQPPDQPRENEYAYLGVYQSYCDEAADERVDRSWFGLGEATVDIDTLLLANGKAQAQLTMYGLEVRAPDCNDPEWNKSEWVDLADVDATFDGAWESAGRLRTSVDARQFVGVGFVYHSQDVNRARDAEATATLTGFSQFGVADQLGTTDEAELHASDNSTVEFRS